VELSHVFGRVALHVVQDAFMRNDGRGYRNTTGLVTTLRGLLLSWNVQMLNFRSLGMVSAFRSAQ
jgi:hypothetical protein